MIRESEPRDFNRILALNLEFEHYLSPLDRDRLDRLHRQAACRMVAEDGGVVAAFVLALREGADYHSPNYRWFVGRYRRFVYIDRVVVAAGYRRRGHALGLYRAVFDHAREQGVEQVVCEYDIEPANEASRRFHDRLGFREVGRQRLYEGARQVSLVAAPVTT